MRAYSALSVLLPQALAGILSVALLARLVRRSSGPIAGLLAGFTLAITPISVITNRSMNVDSLLTLVVLMAAWAISIAAETGRLRFVLLCAALIGLGFNIKTLAAFLFVPAFALLYWFTAPLPWRKRLLHLVLAAGLLLIISCIWISAVDLTPATQRPYVGSSGDNSEWQLTLLYNGYQRYTGTSNLRALSSSARALFNHLPAFTFISYEVGNPGFLRLLSNPLGSQIGWLLPFAIPGLLAARWDRPTFWPLNRTQQAVVLWGVWFITLYIVFSVAGLLHAYYTALLVPAICALFAISIVTAWQDYRQSRRRWLLPLTVAGTAAMQTQLLMAYLQTGVSWLLSFMLALSLLAVVGLLLLRCYAQVYTLFISVAIVALVLAPISWSMISLFQQEKTPFPSAGPPAQETPLQKQVDVYATELTSPAPSLIHYLLEHQGKTFYLAATFDATSAAPLILATGKPVMALGGYQGNDRILTKDQLEHLIRTDRLRFFLLPRLPGEALLSPDLRGYLLSLQRLGPVLNYQSPTSLIEWVSARCPVVPSVQWSTKSPASSNQSLVEENTVFDLYDCASSPGRGARG